MNNNKILLLNTFLFIITSINAIDNIPPTTSKLERNDRYIQQKFREEYETELEQFIK